LSPVPVDVEVSGPRRLTGSILNKVASLRIT
jgi:hypothetical protein